MLDPSQLAAKKQQPSEDSNTKATSPAIVIMEEANSGVKSEANLPENAPSDKTRAEQNVTPTPKVRTTPKNPRKKPKTAGSGKGSQVNHGILLFYSVLVKVIRLSNRKIYEKFKET